MKVSAAHLEAFIGAVDDCDLGSHHLIIDGESTEFPGCIGLTVDWVAGENTESLPIRLEFATVSMGINFALAPEFFPADMIRAHVAAGLNQQIARVGWARKHGVTWDQMVWKHIAKQP